MTTARPPAEIRALTGLRGLAALDVMLGHYDIHTDRIPHLFVFHDAAVDIFFALSSFTLCLVYGAGTGRKLDWRGFAVARFARIYPLYAATALFYAWEIGRSLGRAGLLRHLLSQMLMLAALPIPRISGFWDVPAWSVAVEAVCYTLVFPLLFRLPVRDRDTHVMPLLAVAASLAAMAAYVWGFEPAANDIGTLHPLHRIAYWVALCRGICMFVAGWAAFRFYSASPAVRQVLGQATDAIALLMLVCILGEAAGLIRKQALIIAAPFLIAGLMDGRSATARLLGTRPLHAAGTISYGIYLLHVPVYFLLIRHNLLPRQEIWRFLLPMALTLLAATLSHAILERPARRFLRSHLTRGQLSAASSVA